MANDNNAGRPHRIEIVVTYKCSWCGFKKERIAYIDDAARTKRVDIDADSHRVCPDCQVKLTPTHNRTD